MTKKDLTQMPLNECLSLTTHGLPETTLTALSAFTTQQWIDLDGVDRALALRDAAILLPENVSYAALAESIDAALQTLQVEVEAVVIAASVKVDVPQQPANRFAHLLTQGQSASGLDAAALSPRINAQFIKAAAQAILAYVLTGTGVLKVLMAPDLWQTLMIEDLEVRTMIDEWLEKVEQGTYITPKSSDALREGVKKLFGPRFEKFMKTVSRYASQFTSLDMMGKQAIVDIGEDAEAFAGLGNMIPLLAEEVSQNMIASRMPEFARRLVKMVTDLMAILKHPVLQAYAGVVGARSVDEGAVMLLSKRLGPAIGNQIRLALAYEAFVNALAECPSEVDSDYLKVVGILAARLNNLFEIVQPDREVATTASPFRGSPVAVAAPQPIFGFSLNLSVTWRHG